METQKKFWIIKNITDNQVKITAAASNTNAPGLILQKEQFCIAEQRITAVLDSQQRRKLVIIEEFDNSAYKLNLCKAYDKSILDKVKESVKDYSK